MLKKVSNLDLFGREIIGVRDLLFTGGCTEEDAKARLSEIALPRNGENQVAEDYFDALLEEDVENAELKTLLEIYFNNKALLEKDQNLLRASKFKTAVNTPWKFVSHDENALIVPTPKTDSDPASRSKPSAPYKDFGTELHSIGEYGWDHLRVKKSLPTPSTAIEKAVDELNQKVLSIIPNPTHFLIEDKGTISFTAEKLHIVVEPDVNLMDANTGVIVCLDYKGSETSSTPKKADLSYQLICAARLQKEIAKQAGITPTKYVLGLLCVINGTPRPSFTEFSPEGLEDAWKQIASEYEANRRLFTPLREKEEAIMITNYLGAVDQWNALKEEKDYLKKRLSLNLKRHPDLIQKEEVFSNWCVDDTMRTGLESWFDTTIHYDPSICTKDNFDLVREGFLKQVDRLHDSFKKTFDTLPDLLESMLQIAGYPERSFNKKDMQFVIESHRGEELTTIYSLSPQGQAASRCSL